MHSSNNRGMRDWMIFILVAETGSLSRAAKALGVSVAAVSKSVSRLENFVSASLIRRDSRKLELTCAGQTAYWRAKDITAAFNALLSDLRNPGCDISGQIRLSAPALMCEFLANYWVIDYAKMHPETKVILSSREGSEFDRNSPEFDDLVFKSGFIDSEELIHRRLNPVKLLLCASPDYLRNHKEITHPAELKAHLLLGIIHPWLSQAAILTNDSESFTLTMNHHSGLLSNSVFALLNLLLNGEGGVMILPAWLAKNYVQAGQLEVVLPQWKIPDMPVYLVWRHRKFYSPLFRDFARIIEERWNQTDQELPV
ncbi:transcriptional regulator [Erwinia sp. OLTSP20]|uniref:LysR family transcriptional regulator n=1 Tax=unclassified Erwinia TaxID=2622719 RepID=UPI000C174F39|nr:MULTISPECIES: LysR family transcriptional regulator [unclassified Erwinia]PIJ49847.1 transcriptional regulator [Erwinia sp. OAMSP11]PIJ70946.1 transcriptional regulator [Erwinia sp. OLSSP12]PIJ80312.1 transcriptional regulator [Erwinia sp. OLCASP19]PIJ82436.1 transcriptional regulator [Erwinia sp. OLMTSP26]PIJ85121.1 transcriptional regulator [Erwinia sp. OLMDSP33]